MSHANVNGPPREWLQKMADAEDACGSVSVGGMAVDLGVLPSNHSEARRVFARLIALARRKKGLSLEELARQAEIDLAEMIQIESIETAVPSARTVDRLAKALDLPTSRLMEVAGLALSRPEVSRAALEFAARTKPTEVLSSTEHDAFDEFVKVLLEFPQHG